MVRVDLVLELGKFTFNINHNYMKMLNKCLSLLDRVLFASRCNSHHGCLALTRPKAASAINDAQCLRDQQHTASLLQGRMSPNGTRVITLGYLKI